MTPPPLSPQPLTADIRPPEPMSAVRGGVHDAGTLDRLRRAGRAAASSLADAGYDREATACVKARSRALRQAIGAGLTTEKLSKAHQEWLAGNARLIVSAEKVVRNLASQARRLPAARSAPDRPAQPRASVLAEAYLRVTANEFDEELFVAFLAGAQEVVDLQMGELWAARPALQLALLEQVISAAVDVGGRDLPVLLTSLRALGDTHWEDVFEQANVVDTVLVRDPVGAYAAMVDESRELYRQAVADLARHSPMGERAIAEAAMVLAERASLAGRDTRAGARRAHVGYYLIDEGLSRLRESVGYRAPLSVRLADLVRTWPTTSYVGAVLGLMVLLLGAVHATAGSGAAVAVALLLLALPASQSAVELVNNLVAWLLPPRRLAKLDFSDGIPDDCATMVAVPSLLLDERHVRELVLDMEIRYLANRDDNLSFALVTNSRDSRQRREESDEPLHLAERLVTELNQRYGTGGRTPFYLLHRRLAYSPSEGLWMGWERKRGKLLDLNQLLRGVRDRFPVKVGNLDLLRRIRYVITLDSDTQLPRDAARRLVGTIAHPLNRAVIDPATRTVVQGYGILQPRISVSTQSATRTWLASLYAGESGFDIYTRAVSDVYQDLFGEGNFTGKGIYEVDAFRESLEHRFPTNTLLSHDLIEGLFARAGLVSDIELVDDYPTHFSAYCRRKHRWMRGDWQILLWLGRIVPDYRRRSVVNPLGALSRWKIVDNLRRSLLEPAALGTLLVAWLWLPASVAALWTAALLAILLLPAYVRVLIAMTGAPWRSTALRPWAASTLVGLARTHVVTLLHLVYLLHDALLAVDAIVRSLARMFVTRRRLLEWETAAEAALRVRGATDVYLERAPYVAAALGVLLWWRRPEVLPVAGGLIALWIASRAVASWLNRPLRLRTADLAADDARFLREHAVRTWGFFRAFSGADANWLVPDFVRADGVAAQRLTPTNLGFLLNARVAAVHFGYLTLPEFAAETGKTLDTVLRLRRYRGHLLNWYDTQTLAELEPRFISTVDSGNLAAALWALKEAAAAWVEEPPAPDVLWQGIADVARMLAADGSSAGQTLGARVLRAGDRWRQQLPQLEALVAHGAAAADGEAGAWTRELLVRLRQARLWHEYGMSSALRRQLAQIAATAETLAAEMDFAFLYDERRKVLSIGYDVNTGRLDRSTYDLLASEARIASFVAIAKGDIPQESWMHLGRAHIATRGERVLLSWTGTLFEYAMPALWFRHRPGTILRQSMCAAVAVQRRFARHRRIPWGFSESAHIVRGSTEYGYAPCGLAELALKPADREAVVVSPYSTYLALLVDKRAALENLRRLVGAGAVGRYGFFEAVDYSHEAPQVVQSWMAHHQGMILLATAEMLCGHPFQQAFHSNPHVRATERLLDERLPRAIVVDGPAQPRLLRVEQSTA